MVDAASGVTAYQLNVEAARRAAEQHTAELTELAAQAPVAAQNDFAGLERLKAFLTHFNFLFHANSTCGDSIWSIYGRSKDQLYKTDIALTKFKQGKDTGITTTGSIIDKSLA